MPVYMNSGKIVAGRVDGDSKVLQEVLADLKSAKRHILWKYSQIEGEWSFYWGNLNFYTKKSRYGQKTPPFLEMPEFSLHVLQPFFPISLIEDKGKRFV